MIWVIKLDQARSRGTILPGQPREYGCANSQYILRYNSQSPISTISPGASSRYYDRSPILPHFVALNFKFCRLDPAMPPNRISCCGNEKRENAYPKYVGAMCWWLRFHATSPFTATVYTSISCATWTMDNDQKTGEDQELLAYKWAPLILLPLVGYLYP
jgi:hypothetical protein